MKPLFSVHAGEYLVGSHIEHRFRRVNVWVPDADEQTVRAVVRRWLARLTSPALLAVLDHQERR